MSRLAYVNGAFCAYSDARVHIEDRGYQFADGVYEVWAFRQHRILDWGGHWRRLQRSLGELSIAVPVRERALRVIAGELIRRNRLSDGILYLQITRGVAARDHVFPQNPVAPAMVMTARAQDLASLERKANMGIAIISLPENRWGRCDIKSIALLPNVLAKQAAAEQGAPEAWFVDAQGQVTEGASSNAWILDHQGCLRTRNLHANILPGITRANLVAICQAHQITLREEAFSLDEALHAKEAFITSASAFVQPVIRIDGKEISSGVPGPLAKRLRTLYLEQALCDQPPGE